MHQGTLRFTTETKPYMILELSAEGGIKTIPVYATTKFAKQLNGLEQNQLVTPNLSDLDVPATDSGGRKARP